MYSGSWYACRTTMGTLQTNVKLWKVLSLVEMKYTLVASQKIHQFTANIDYAKNNIQILLEEIWNLMNSIFFFNVLVSSHIFPHVLDNKALVCVLKQTVLINALLIKGGTSHCPNHDSSDIDFAKRNMQKLPPRRCAQLWMKVWMSWWNMKGLLCCHWCDKRDCFITIHNTSCHNIELQWQFPNKIKTL